MTEDAFQVPAPAAAAKALFGIQRNDGVPAFPHAFAPGIAAEAHTVSERPHANEFLQLVVLSGNPRGHGVGIIKPRNGSDQAARRQRRLQIETLHLMQVGRILDDSAAYHPGKSQTNGANLLALRHGVDLLLDAVPDVFRGHGLQSFQRSALLWIKGKGAGEFVVLNQTDRDVFHYEYAD